MRNKLDLFSTNENEKTSQLVHIIHSYDYNGNHIKRYDPVHAANSKLYTYDNSGQIKTLNRGVLNNDHTSIPTENRDHNAANELQGIANHDANGNMALMLGLKGKYDAMILLNFRLN
jgi:hypothetical protein